VPEWQCPACGIAYHKYQAYLQRARKAVTPLQADAAPPQVTADSSIWSLLAANIFTLIAAVYLDWSVSSLMLIYWCQSIAIGISYFLRILSLEKFSTENFRINNRPVDPTPATKFQVGVFFLFHYGFFHLGYFIFLNFGQDEPLALDNTYWICITAFIINHLWSYRYNRDLDRMGTPNIGTMMFTPYLRIIPMHLTLIFGGLYIDTQLSLLLFGVLKTLADAGMHLVEHAQLRKLRNPAADDRQ
jgi:hypothetical protein